MVPNKGDMLRLSHINEFANKENAFTIGTDLGKAFCISPKCESSGSPYPHSDRSAIGKLSEAVFRSLAFLLKQNMYIGTDFFFLRYSF